MPDGRPPPTPSVERLAEIARSCGLGVTRDELASYRTLIDGILRGYERLDEVPDARPATRYVREDVRAPAPHENPSNAWAWRCRIRGADAGPLAGWRIAVKDNVCVAGVPMRAGSALLDGFTPDVDATVVTRLLDAGAHVVGKAACEDLCFSGGSHTAITGPVPNPHDPTRMAGGSSSGPAALVAVGDVDAAIGTDQGGSIAIPSAWCGVVGIKPTFGLVPYSGIMPVEPTVDHAGPIARTVADATRVLESIAGPDAFDPRQRGVDAPVLADALTEDATDLRVGVLAEGFGWEESEPDVDALVTDAVEDRFGRAGADVTRESVAMHRLGEEIMNAVWTEGARRTLLAGHGMSASGEGYHALDLMRAIAANFPARSRDLSPNVKLVLLLGSYMTEETAGDYYGRAQNLRPALRAAYDDALERVDALALPAVPFKAQPFPEPDASPAEVVNAGYQTQNTCPFDLTGHPTVTLNAGWSDGLPVGVMLVGRRGDERTLLRAAHAFESAEREIRAPSSRRPPRESAP